MTSLQNLLNPEYFVAFSDLIPGAKFVSLTVGNISPIVIASHPEWYEHMYPYMEKPEGFYRIKISTPLANDWFADSISLQGLGVRGFDNKLNGLFYDGRIAQHIVNQSWYQQRLSDHFDMMRRMKVFGPCIT